MASDVSGTLIQMARIALDWKQEKLAAEAGCHVTTIGKIEKGFYVNETTRRDVVLALEQAGMVFLPPSDLSGAGVRWASHKLESTLLAQKQARERESLERRMVEAAKRRAQREADHAGEDEEG